jgi:predicted membrane-bound dolichyl-phosphate-mannose-protein mannosyltransferase
VKTYFRLEPEFRRLCAEKDSDISEETYNEIYKLELETGYVGVPVYPITHAVDILDDQFKDMLETEDVFKDPIITFNNLKILKRYLQQKGTIIQKEVILLMIKNFKNGLYEE